MRRALLHVTALLLAVLLLACQDKTPTPSKPPAPTTTQPSPQNHAPPAPDPKENPKKNHQSWIVRSGSITITLEDYDKALHKLALFSPDGKVPPELLTSPRFQQNTALNLLSIWTLREASDRADLTLSDEEFREHLNTNPKLQRFAKLDAKSLTEALAQHKLTPKDLRDVVSDRVRSEKLKHKLVPEPTDDVLWQAWKHQKERTEIQYVAVSNTPPSNAITRMVRENPREIETYYKEHPSEYAVPATRRVRMIQRTLPLQYTPDQEAQVQEKLRSLRTQALAGEDFAALAKTHSQHHTSPQGGDLGFVVRRQNPDAFKTEVGQISDVLRNGKGFFILKVEQELPSRTQELTPGVRRETAAKILRRKTISSDARKTSEDVILAWKKVPQNPARPHKPFDDLLKTHHLSRGKTFPFPSNSPDDAFIPGIGRAPEIMKAIRALTPENPISPKPILFQEKLYVLGLKERGQAIKGQFNQEKETFKTQWIAHQKKNANQTLVDRWQKENGVEMNLHPVANKYGKITKKP